MSIAEKLQTVYDGVEDVRDALQEIDINLGRGTVDTLGDDIRTLSAGGAGYGFKVYGDVRTEEEVEVEDPDTHEITTETEYTYTRSLILDSTLAASGDDLNTDVIDGIGELNGNMVNITGGLVQIPLNTGVVITVDPTLVYVKFRDPVVENIVITHWGTSGKITLAQVRAITSLSTYFKSSAIVTFNEFKWFDGINVRSNAENLFFENCTVLTDIKLPRVTTLGVAPFSGCSALTHLEIPDTFADLGQDGAGRSGFVGKTAVEELTIPSSVMGTSVRGFHENYELKKIVWGNNLSFPNQSGKGQSFYRCYDLEKIENLPNVGTGATVSFRECSNLDFSNIYPLVIPNVDDNWLVDNAYYFYQTKVFDYAPNGVVTFDKITTNPNNRTLRYLLVNNSEAGYIINLPNWTINPTGMGDNRAGKIVFSENVTTMGNFGLDLAASVIIIPCSTPPTLTATPTTANGARIYVPESSLSLYQSVENWSSLSTNRLRGYKDPSTANFCSIPQSAPVPSDYTKVHYISNINADNTIKNCQISNLEYKPKQYSQYLLDFSHEYDHTASYPEDQSCLFYTDDPYTRDFKITIESGEYDRWPVIHRRTSANNYTNRMGMVDNQKFFFNSKVTGEAFGQRSVFKWGYYFMEYHGLVHQVDPNTGDSVQNLTFLYYSSNSALPLCRKVKIYRLCIFEPLANCNDYNDSTQYEIVRDYIPVMRNSDGVFGLYERLTDSFYPSTIAGAPFSGPAYE